MTTTSFQVKILAIFTRKSRGLTKDGGFYKDLVNLAFLWLIFPCRHTATYFNSGTLISLSRDCRIAFLFLPFILAVDNLHPQSWLKTFMASPP
jgi:hypothetical protein